MTLGKKDRANSWKKICIFGNFVSANPGNESTLQALLFHLQRLMPDVEVVCACTGPDVLARTHKIAGVPISGTILKRFIPHTPLFASLRRMALLLPSEIWRSLQALWTVRTARMLIIPGTGLLTDAYGLKGSGPYNLLKWTLLAKLCGCEIVFISVGAGPIYTSVGKYLIKTALALSDFTSYRDAASLEYLARIGVKVSSGRVYPDLVFSLPEGNLPVSHRTKVVRPVVGLGVMAYAGSYSVADPNESIYRSYLENLVIFAQWLLTHDYDIKLIIGDVSDISTVQDFKSLLKASTANYDDSRVGDQPAFSVDQLLLQLSAADLLVATRFHNVLFGFLLNKPLIAISFHHKCVSLMEQMGMEKYCHDINHMNASRLIEQFQEVERDRGRLKSLIRERVERARESLDEQYALIFRSAS